MQHVFQKVLPICISPLVFKVLLDTTCFLVSSMWLLGMGTQQSKLRLHGTGQWVQEVWTHLCSVPMHLVLMWSQAIFLVVVFLFFHFY